MKNMKKPDTVFAKYLFLVIIIFLVIFIFSVILWILQLSGKCSTPNSQQEDKKKKKNTTIIYLFLFILICSMAAQAVNQSYTVIIPKGAAKAAANTLKNV